MAQIGPGGFALTDNESPDGAIRTGTFFIASTDRIVRNQPGHLGETAAEADGGWPVPSCRVIREQAGEMADEFRSVFLSRLLPLPPSLPFLSNLENESIVAE